MKLDEMTLVVRVAEAGSMTRAAHQLGLTSAGVSAAVRRIEDGLGMRLFERTTRSLHPTDEGIAIIDGCEEVLDRWQRTLERVRKRAGRLSGTVHISAPADTAYDVISPVVVALSDAHPELQIVLHSSDALHHLHRDAIDMAIRYGELDDSSLVARRLASGPGVLVASPTYLARHGNPASPYDLAEHRCLTLRLSSAPVTSWSLVGPGGTRVVALDSPLCGDGYLARRWALDGVGIARKNVFDVIDDLESGRLVRVLREYRTEVKPIHAIVPSRRYQPARVRAVADAIRAAFEARSARCDAWLARET